MANILTTTEAATVLRCSVDDPSMLAMLPGIDASLFKATGHAWALDNPINEIAKSAARMMLVQWHENPGMVGSDQPLSFGLSATIMQLKAIAMLYMEFFGCNGVGSCYLPYAHYGDKVDSLVDLSGETGDQSTSFETYISCSGQIQQISESDLSEVLFRVKLTPKEEL
jgi:hypothetical protein